MGAKTQKLKEPPAHRLQEEPAEGSREVIDRELERQQKEKTSEKKRREPRSAGRPASK